MKRKASEQGIRISGFRRLAAAAVGLGSRTRLLPYAISLLLPFAVSGQAVQPAYTPPGYTQPGTMPTGTMQSRPMQGPGGPGRPGYSYQRPGAAGAAAAGTMPAIQQAAPPTTAVAAPSLLDQPAQVAKVDLSAGKLTVQADNSSLTAILHQVSTSAGMTIDGLSKDVRVFGTYGPGDPRDVISSLLDGTGYNFVMFGKTSSGTPTQLTLTTRGAPLPTGLQGLQRGAIMQNQEEEEDPGPTQYPDATPPPVAPQTPPPAPPQNGGVRSPQQMLQELQQMHQQQQQEQQTAPPPQ